MSSVITSFYTHHILPLQPDERLELLSLIAQDLIPMTKPKKKHSIEELRGLGKEIWEGVDAQEYVDSLRQEWESPSC